MKRVISNLLCAMCVAAGTSGPALAGDLAAGSGHIRIRVYDASGMPARILRNAMDAAGTIFEHAGVSVAWTVCPGRGRAARMPRACNVPVSSEELVLRLIAGPCRADAWVLGTAVIDEANGRGVLATAYVDRISTTAARAGTDAGLLLGRVAAHEVGHLLLGPQSHSTTGLMRGNWPVELIRQNRPDDFRFSIAQRGRLVETIARRTRGGMPQAGLALRTDNLSAPAR